MAGSEKNLKKSGGCLKWIVLLGLGFVLLSAAMWLLKICPPSGPWPAPPWCAGGIQAPGIFGQKPGSVNPTSTAEMAVEPAPLPTPAGPRVEISGTWLFPDPGDDFMQPTIISFAGTGGPDVEDIKTIHDLGMKYTYQVSLWQHDRWHTLEDLPAELKNAYTSDLDGSPIIIQEDFIHLNTLDPAWQDWLINDMLYKLENGADGIIVDEISGTAQAIWLGGSFDEISLKGFRDYLSRQYTGAELARKGVSDPESFNYKEYILENGYEDEFRQGRPLENPLGLDFRDFLQLETNRFIARLMDEALAFASESGREISVSANMDPFNQNDRMNTFAEKMNTFTFEHSFFADWWRADNPDFAKLAYGYPVVPQVALARGLDKRSNVLMILRDYSVLRDKGEPEASRMVAHAMAETYAAGGSFCYFDFLTEYAAEGPYTVNRAAIKPYYDFLHSQPELFLETEPQQAKIALVAPPRGDPADMSPNSAVQGFAWMLLESNIPFNIVDLSKIMDYEVVYTHGFSWSAQEVQVLLDFVSQGGVVIVDDSRFAGRDENFLPVKYPELEGLKRNGEHAYGDGAFVFSAKSYGFDYFQYHQRDELEAILKVVGKYITPNQAPANVVVLPWVGEEMFVLHVINNNFAGDYIKQQDLELRVQIPEGFNTENKILKIYNVETGGILEQQYQIEDGWLVFTMPTLDIWGVAALV